MRWWRRRGGTRAEPAGPRAEAPSWAQQCLTYWRAVLAAEMRRAPNVDEKNRQLAAQLAEANRQSVFWMMRDVVFGKASMPGGAGLDGPTFMLGADGMSHEAPTAAGASDGGGPITWHMQGGLTIERSPETRSEIAARTAELDADGRFLPRADFAPDPWSRWRP